MDDERFGLRYPGKADALQLAHGEPGARLVRASASDDPGFDDAHDVLIEGDNLEALRLMRGAYAGMVQCIYIDPPYNTGHDFVYRDRFAEGAASYGRRSAQLDEEGARLVANPESHGRFHSSWLAMMEPRLRVAHELLHDDGLLFVSIDDHEVHHLRVLLDEIFGPECFVSQIVVVGNRGGRDYLRIATTHEYLLCYGRSPDAPVRPLPRQGPAPRHRDGRGPFELRELRNRNPRFSPANRPNLFYPIWVDPQRADADGLCPVGLEERDGWVPVEPRNREGAPSVWRWGRRGWARRSATTSSAARWWPGGVATACSTCTRSTGPRPPRPARCGTSPSCDRSRAPAPCASTWGSPPSITPSRWSWWSAASGSAAIPAGWCWTSSRARGPRPRRWSASMRARPRSPRGASCWCSSPSPCRPRPRRGPWGRRPSPTCAAGGSRR